MKVWVVTNAGEYGEYYNVEGVYATKELAQERVDFNLYTEVARGMFKHRTHGDYITIQSYTVWEE
jgi:hypothetical protein